VALAWPKQIATAVELQIELVRAWNATSRDWTEKFQAEWTLWADFVRDLGLSQTPAEATSICSRCTARQMEMSATDIGTMMARAHDFSQAMLKAAGQAASSPEH